jgi:hypothetical protein
MTGGAVLQGGRQIVPVAECTSGCSRHTADSIQVCAVAAVAGVKAGGAGFTVEIPRSADGIERCYSAEGGGDLKDPGMGRQGGMTDLASGIPEGGINKPAELNIETRIAPRPSEGIIRMALLAVRQVSLGCLAVVVRVCPAGWMAHLSMAKSAVEAARFAGVVGGDDRSPQIGPVRVTECADRCIQPLRIINGIRVGRSRIGPPWNGRMGRPHRNAVRHVARAGGPARGKTANSG